MAFWPEKNLDRFGQVFRNGVIENDDYNIFFNVSTKGSPLANGKLTTQIVNKQFKLTISAKDNSKNTPLADVNITRLDLVRSDGTLENLSTAVLTTNSCGLAYTNVTVPFADRDSTIKITGEYKGQNFSNNASDNFAIRPDKFVLTVPANNIAGRNFKINAVAEDAAGNPSNSYNESVGGNSSCQIVFSEKDSDAVTGVMNLDGIVFSNGNVTKITSYSEVGGLNFTISERKGHEFAQVDAGDTSDAERYITPATVSDRLFKTDHFEISDVKMTSGSTGFTYYAAPVDMQEMSATLSFTIKSLNKNGGITKNYKANVYAKDVISGFYFDTLTDASQQNVLAWEEDGNATHAQHNALVINGSEHNKSVAYDVSRLRFLDGISTVSVKINFNRDIHQVKEPMLFIVKKIVVVSEDNRIGVKEGVSLRSDFYYGRLYISDLVTEGKKMDIPVFHEVYCKKSDRHGVFSVAGGPESVDQIYWYRINSGYDDGKSGFMNPRGVYHPVNTLLFFPSGVISFSNPVLTSNSMDKMSLEVPVAQLPFRDMIRYQPKPWLVYKRFGSAVSATHHFNVTLNRPPQKWAGKGGVGSSVDLKISGRKNYFEIIDW